MKLRIIPMYAYDGCIPVTVYMVQREVQDWSLVSRGLHHGVQNPDVDFTQQHPKRTS